MDGYSVEEAAEVLGIPQGRVWELIARGVLAGAAEGRSDMRVFLKPAAASEPSRSGVDRANGGGREQAGDGGRSLEASPFRELLTEFRNLTERYGQALLALGEARGEVAALRSRVEVLEARMDMRLPLRSASTVAWELPDRYAGQAAAPPTTTEEPPTEVAPAPGPSLEDAGTADVSLPEPPLPGDEPGSDAEPAVEPEQPPVEAEVDGHTEPEPVDEIEVEPGTTGTEAFPHVRFVLPDEPPSEPPKRRVSGGRAAVAGLAEALARAEDPTLADLPGAREAAAALAALQQAVGPDRADDSDATASEASQAVQPEPPAAEEAEAALEPSPAAFAQPMSEVEDEPEDEPIAADSVGREEGGPAEPVSAEQPEVQPEPSADETPSMYSTEVVEPDWFADGDFTWLDASDAEREHVERGAEAPAVDALQDAFAGPPAADAPSAPEPDAEPEPEVEREPEPEPEPEVELPAADVPSERGEMEHVAREQEAPAAEAIQEAFDEPAVPQSGTDAWPARDREPITGSGGVGFGLFRSPVDAPRARVAPVTPSEEEAILWFGDEFEIGDLEVAAPGWRDQEQLEAAPPPAAKPEPRAEPWASVPEGTAEDVEAPQPELTEPTEDEIAGLAAQGWDSAEVEAIRSYLGRAPGIAHGPGAGAGGPSTPAHDQDWLRGRRGPAATAYRRLRRLFQG